ncbi:DUF3365 domain-containing protein [Halioxenophilus sp. WMMB6]|uniref:c-type heme family protein n=1 Tax=Halioxenophilus sp. WMMB6 TaxID=3073815 RepID=UPI00295EF7B7|nr:DUF3365 domain-containing protein [Halioxenophilus sp. WMMB6]
MNKPTHRFAVLLLASAAAQADVSVNKEHVTEERVSEGQALLLPFKQQLMMALKTGLQQGPEAAVAACRLQAPAIAASLSQDGVRIGRTSHKLRNLANVPEPWLQPLLASYLAERDQPPQAVALAEGLVGYVEPITVQPLCLTCHGDALAPALAAKINTLYPDDQATGFQTGDFRGLFWVVFPESRVKAGGSEL